MAVIVLACSFALIVVRGFCIALLWRWFIVPLGAPTIGNAHALGISATVAIIMPGARTDNADKNPAWLQLVGHLLGLGISMLFAWATHTVMLG